MKHVRSIAVIFATGMAAAGAASAQDMYKSGVGGLYTGLNYTFMNLESGNADADVGTPVCQSWRDGDAVSGHRSARRFWRG